MDDCSAMAAAVAQPPPPPPRATGSRRGFFAFLKDGVLVTTRNHGLFLPLTAVHAARSLASLAAKILATWYLGPTLGLEANVGDDGDMLFSALLDKLFDGRWWFLPAAAAYIVAEVANEVLGFAIQAATFCAAVASCSAAAAASSIEGGPGRTTTTTLTLASLLGKVRRNLVGSMETAVFAKVVVGASVVAWNLVLFAVAATVAYVGQIPGELVYLLLRLIATPLAFIYYRLPREVAVVVSVAEPGLRAGDALRRARRLTRGGKKAAQATLHAALSWALNKAVWRMCAVAVARLPHSISIATATFRLDAVVVYMLVAAVEVLYMATVTAYYFDCKRTEEEEKAGHVHVE